MKISYKEEGKTIEKHIKDAPIERVLTAFNRNKSLGVIFIRALHEAANEKPARQPKKKA